MITPEHRKLLQELGATPYGKILQEYLEEEYAKIDTVKGVKTLEETMGRQLAISILDGLFKFMKPVDETKSSKMDYK